MAQYREMEVFAVSSSDLDETTKKQLNHGKALMELLKQKLCKPYSLHERFLYCIWQIMEFFDDIQLMKLSHIARSIKLY